MKGLVEGDVVTIYDSIQLVITDGYWARKRFMPDLPHYDYEGRVLQGPDYLMQGQFLRFDAANITQVHTERAEVHAGPRTL